jgi:hypothetical protein
MAKHNTTVKMENCYFKVAGTCCHTQILIRAMYEAGDKLHNVIHNNSHMCICLSVPCVCPFPSPVFNPLSVEKVSTEVLPGGEGFQYMQQKSK